MMPEKITETEKALPDAATELLVKVDVWVYALMSEKLEGGTAASPS